MARTTFVSAELYLKVRILGTRGVPAQHGGFETFAEHLSLYLRSRAHQVTVYCQVDDPADAGEDEWCGVERIKIHAPDTPMGTMKFDLHSVLHARARDGVILTLGYNTAIFSLLYVLSGRKSVMNMDGIEWAREKWSRAQRLWLRANEFCGAKLSTHLIADHPEIGKHLQTLVPSKKITVIPYGAEVALDADPACLAPFGCQPYEFAVCIARPEPENSILEIVQAFSKQRRGYPLLVLGNLHPETNAYHRSLIEIASDEVRFPGAIYDKGTVTALRTFAKFYVHGHRVGGTNPSLVEALAHGSPIVAQRNRFNEWVAGPQARYFASQEELEQILLEFETQAGQLDQMRQASKHQHAAMFPLLKVHEQYEALLEQFAHGKRFAPREGSGPVHAGL